MEEVSERQCSKHQGHGDQAHHTAGNITGDGEQTPGGSVENELGVMRPKTAVKEPRLHV